MKDFERNSEILTLDLQPLLPTTSNLIQENFHF